MAAHPHATASSHDLIATPGGVLGSLCPGFAEESSPQRSSHVSLKLLHVADGEPFGRTHDTPVALAVSRPQHSGLFLNLPGSAIALPDSSASGISAIRAVSRNPSSMSFRRLASNRPALQCKVDMPPAPIFPSELCVTPATGLLTPSKAAISPLPLSLRQFSIAYSKTRTSSASPVTPIDQIMPTTPLSPPPLGTNISSLSKSKFQNAMPPVRLQADVHVDYTLDYPNHSPVLGLGLDLYGAQRGSPVSSLGMPSPFCLDSPLSAKPGPLATSGSLLPLLPAAPTTNTYGAPEQEDRAVSKESKDLQPSASSCPGPQIFLRARARPPLRLSLPRRLSYNRAGFAYSPGGTPTPRRANHELASPAMIGLKPGSNTGSGVVQNACTSGIPHLHAHQPRMVELGSYF